MSNLFLLDVPRDWIVSELREYLSFISYGFTNPMPDSVVGPYMVTAKDIKDLKVNYTIARKTTREAFKDLLSDKSRPKLGDLLLTKDGTLGRVAIVDRENVCINQSVAVLRANERIDSKFLLQLLASPMYQQMMLDNAGGSTIKHIYITIVDKMNIAVPSYKEQQKIAAILTSVDDVIEKTQAQIDKLKDLKTGMMQELLTRGVGVDGKPHTEFKDSPVGRIPKVWDVLPLENLVKTDKKITYGIVQAGPHCEGGVPYIRVSDMNSRHLTKKGMLLTSPEIATKFARSAVSDGDIVYALRGMIGHVQIVPTQLAGANLTQGTARISPNDKINTDYLFWAMKSPYVAMQNDLEAKGSTFKEVTLASLRNIQIAIPERAEQEYISAALNSIQLKIFVIEDKLTQSKNLKKALMQDLLTGKVRVKLDS